MKPSLEDQWRDEAESCKADAEKLPPGPERDHLLRTARQLKTASHMTDWLSSPGLKPPENAR